MSYLLDTNVVSEWVKERPDAGVTAWLARADEDEVAISVVTIAELRRGIERLPKGRRKSRLDAWLREELAARFEGRILGVEAIVADAWGQIVADCEAAGRPIGLMDALIAATAKVFNLTLVTRNERDFSALVPEILNPWNT